MNELSSVDDIKSRPSSKFYNPTNNISIFPSVKEKSLLPASNEKSILELTLEKIIPIPFNLSWLSEYLGLNKQHVHNSKFDFEFMRYSITFNTLENAQNFYQVLKQAGASLQIWEHTNTLEMALSNQFKLLRSVGQSDTGLNPWNVDFFVQYFDLNKDLVKSDQHSEFYYEIEFHKAHEAYNYYKKLSQNGMYPKEPFSDGILVFSNMNHEILLKGAAKYLKNGHSELFSTNSVTNLNPTNKPSLIFGK